MIVRRTQTDVLLIMDPIPLHQSWSGRRVNGVENNTSRRNSFPSSPTLVTEVLVVPNDFIDAWSGGKPPERA